MTTTSNTDNVVKLSGDVRPPLGRLSQVSKPSMWAERRFAGLTPRDLVSIESALQRGDIERFHDLCSHMLRRDSHLRSVYETLLRGVVSNPIRFEEGRAKAGQESAAEAAVEFCRQSVEDVERSERTLMHLAHGEGTGVAVVEQEWGRRDGAWRVVRHHLVPGRDLRFADDWTVEVRSYSDNGPKEWISTKDEPLRWIVHVPNAVGQAAHLSGLLLSCMWPFAFKKWATTYGVQTLERFAQPLLLGTMPENARDETLSALLTDLQNLIATSTGVVREGVTVEAIDTAASNAGDAHRNFIADFDNQMTKAVLGSTLNVEVGDTGGNRALGESQNATTILPRLRGIGDSLAETLREQWFEPELRLNAHLFNGRRPPVPEPSFELIQDEPPLITQMHVDGGVVTANELRASAGLEPLEGEDGARIVTPIAKTSPSFSRPEDAPPPLASSRASRRSRKPHQLKLPTPKTSPTSSRSRTQIAGVPFDR